MTGLDRDLLSTLPVGRAEEEHPPGRWGMLLLISTEAALFSCLIFGYFYLGVRSESWPPFGPPDLRVASLNTVLLLSSSGTLRWGERGIRLGNVKRLRLGIALTLVLGASFLSLQGYEYSRQPFTPTTDAYGSAFFTVTGMHGAHVFIGLVVLSVLLVMTMLGKFGARNHAYVTNAALYWHFVDAVWLVVFSSLYLSPRLGF